MNRNASNEQGSVISTEKDQCRYRLIVKLEVATLHIWVRGKCAGAVLNAV